jgi:hypothetical protein
MTTVRPCLAQQRVQYHRAETSALPRIEDSNCELASRCPASADASAAANDFATARGTVHRDQDNTPWFSRLFKQDANYVRVELSYGSHESKVAGSRRQPSEE